LSPQWQDASIDLSLLCGGDLDKPVLVTVYDDESDGKHVAMGKFETTVNGLVSAATNRSEFTLVGGRKGKEEGKIIVQKADVAGVESVTEGMQKLAVSPSAKGATNAGEKPSFVDYVAGGCNLNVCVAIDFTGSNGKSRYGCNVRTTQFILAEGMFVSHWCFNKIKGDPRNPGTLHYIHPDGSKNDYEKAISAIVGILEKYDTDKQLAVFGFGAKYGGVVRHCFQCGPTAEVHGVNGVLDAYHAVFQSGLIMSGPTVFTEVIQTAAARATSAQDAAQRKGEQAYTILLIITDGAVSDVNATAAVLDQVSNAPLSVVIVGVGNADFSGMQFLDDASKPGKRDIAQFVEFNKHSRSSVELTSETLHEIPDQLVGYFTSNGIQPRPAIHRGDAEIVAEPEEEEEIDLSLAFGDDGEIVVAAGGNAYYDDFRDGFVSH
jgi:hypothetical protein